jgi:hypothetical protein
MHAPKTGAIAFPRHVRLPISRVHTFNRQAHAHSHTVSFAAPASSDSGYDTGYDSGSDSGYDSGSDSGTVDTVVDTEPASMTLVGFATVAAFTADHQTAFKEALLASFSMVPGLDASQITLTITFVPGVGERRILTAAGVLVTYTFTGVSSLALASISSQVETLNYDQASSSDFVQSFTAKAQQAGAVVPVGLVVVANSNNPTREPTPIPTELPTLTPTAMPSKSTPAPTDHPTLAPTDVDTCGPGQKLVESDGTCQDCEAGKYMAASGHTLPTCMDCMKGQFANTTGLSSCEQCENNICWSDKEGVPTELSVLGQLSGGFVLTIVDWNNVTNYHGYPLPPKYRLEGVKMFTDTTDQEDEALQHCGCMGNTPFCNNLTSATCNDDWDSFFKVHHDTTDGEGATAWTKSDNVKGCSFVVKPDADQKETDNIRFVKEDLIQDMSMRLSDDTTSLPGHLSPSPTCKFLGKVTNDDLLPADMTIVGKGTWYFRVAAIFAGDDRSGKIVPDVVSYSPILKGVVADPAKALVLASENTKAQYDPAEQVRIGFVTAANPAVTHRWKKDGQYLDETSGSPSAVARRRLAAKNGGQALTQKVCEINPNSPKGANAANGRRWLPSKGLRALAESTDDACAVPDFYNEKTTVLPSQVLQSFELNITGLARQDAGSYELELVNYKGTTTAHTVMVNVACSKCETCVASSKADICAENDPRGCTAGEDLGCICSDGFYWEYSDPTAQSPPHKLGFKCTACPLGGICKDNTQVEGIITNESYYRVNASDHRLYKCNDKPKGACIVATVTGGTPAPGLPQQQCLNTTEGILCHKCIDEPKHFMKINTCVPCPSLDYDAKPLANGMMVVTIILMMFLCSELLRRPIEVKPEETIQTKAASTAIYNAGAVDSHGSFEDSDIAAAARPPPPAAPPPASGAVENLAEEEGQPPSSPAQEEEGGGLAEAGEETAGLGEETAGALEEFQSNETPVSGVGGGTSLKIPLKIPISLEPDGMELVIERMKIAVTWAQCLGPFIFTFSIPWPKGFLDQLTFLDGIVNIDFLSIMGNIGAAACEFDTTFLSTFVFSMSILPVLLLIMLGGFIIAKFRGMKNVSKQKAKGKIFLSDESATLKTRAVQTILSALFLLYPGICNKTFRLFKCTEYSGNWYLDADLNIECSEGVHSQYMILGGFAMGIYTIGIPLFFLALLFSKRKQIALFDEKLKAGEGLTEVQQMQRSRWGHLYEAYNADDWYFEVVEMARKMVLTGGLVLITPGSAVQILLGICVCAVYLCVMINSQPFKSASENNLCQMTAWQLFGTLLIGLWITTAKFAAEAGGDVAESNPYEEGITSAILLTMYFFTLVVVILMIGITMYTFCKKGKEAVMNFVHHDKSKPVPAHELENQLSELKVVDDDAKEVHV